MFKKLALSLVLALGACSDAELISEELDTDAEALVYGQVTFIRSLATGKCFDVPWGQATVGLPINQFTCHGGGAQQFALHPLGGFGFGIRNTYNNRCVDIEGNPTAGYKLRQNICNYSSGTFNTQRFFFGSTVLTPQGPAREIVSGYNSSLCVDVPNAAPIDSLRLQLFGCHGGANQRWLTL